MFKKREKLQVFMVNTFLNIENPRENRLLEFVSKFSKSP